MTNNHPVSNYNEVNLRCKVTLLFLVALSDSWSVGVMGSRVQLSSDCGNVSSELGSLLGLVPGHSTLTAAKQLTAHCSSPHNKFAECCSCCPRLLMRFSGVIHPSPHTGWGCPQMRQCHTCLYIQRMSSSHFCFVYLEIFYLGSLVSTTKVKRYKRYLLHKMFIPSQCPMTLTEVFILFRASQLISQTFLTLSMICEHP